MALPPSSPRLPSPPPPAEIQIGPKSPAAAGSSSLAQQQLEQAMEQTALDAHAKRRIHPGTRAADFAAGPPLVPLSELDSAFQLQEHLAALHYFHTARGTQPLTRATAGLLAQAPPGTDRTLWLYELCRFLIAQCNRLIVGFLFDTPPCSAATCPEMRASEWQFLCAVHEQPKSCCAIDYCCHTLDWAANVVTNPKIFPSRFVFADAHDKNAAVKNLINVFRRLHRIFAHAWFQHRGVFWAVEGETGLYVFFKTVSDLYDLLSAENYKLPPEAEGLVDTSAATYTTPSASTAPAAPAAAATTAPVAASSSSLSPPPNIPGLIPMAAIADRQSLSVDSEHPPSVGHTNTRRHIRSSPSTGSAVTTVLEQDEDGPSASSSSAAAVPPIFVAPEVPLESRRAGAATAVAVAVPVEVGADADVQANEEDAVTIEHVKSVPVTAAAPTAAETPVPEAPAVKLPAEKEAAAETASDNTLPSNASTSTAAAATEAAPTEETGTESAPEESPTLAPDAVAEDVPTLAADAKETTDEGTEGPTTADDEKEEEAAGPSKAEEKPEEAAGAEESDDSSPAATPLAAGAEEGKTEEPAAEDAQGEAGAGAV